MAASAFLIRVSPSRPCSGKITDSNAARHKKALIEVVELWSNYAQETCGNCRHFKRLLDPSEHHDELISDSNVQIVSCSRVTSPNLFAALLKKVIPSRMAEGIVNNLKLIEIEEEHCNLVVVAPGTSYCLCESVQKERSIREPCQSIMVCKIVDSFFSDLAVGDVGQCSLRNRGPFPKDHALCARFPSTRSCCRLCDLPDIRCYVRFRLLNPDLA